MHYQRISKTATTTIGLGMLKRGDKGLSKLAKGHQSSCNLQIILSPADADQRLAIFNGHRHQSVRRH
jgi:hypothetical protein